MFEQVYRSCCKLITVMAEATTVAYQQNEMSYVKSKYISAHPNRTQGVSEKTVIEIVELYFRSDSCKLGFCKPTHRSLDSRAQKITMNDLFSFKYCSHFPSLSTISEMEHNVYQNLAEVRSLLSHNFRDKGSMVCSTVVSELPMTDYF